MAKMFYTMKEAMDVTNRTEEDLKQYAREGRLREFRDGPRTMYKADQIENLKSELWVESKSEVSPQNDLEPHPDVYLPPVTEQPKITQDSPLSDDVKIIDNHIKGRNFYLSLEVIASILRKMSKEDTSCSLNDLADRIMKSISGLHCDRQKFRDELIAAVNMNEIASNNLSRFTQRVY